MNQLTGTGVALVTPFQENGSIDFKGLTRLVHHVTKGGVEFLVVMGTTGEAATLSREERKAVLDHILEANDAKLPIVLGIGGNNTHEVTETLKNTNPAGITAILSVSPYYNKPQQEGIYQHFRAVAGASPLPLILYNVPGRTSSNMTAETVLRLAHDFPNIIAVKEASGNLVQIMEIIRKRPQGFLLLSGDDVLTLPLIALGANGVISVVANPLPALFSTMVRDALAGKLEVARHEHYGLMDIIDLLFADGSPSGAKAALEILGVCGNYLRLPLVGVNPGVYDRLRAAIALVQ